MMSFSVLHKKLISYEAYIAQTENFSLITEKVNSIKGIFAMEGGKQNGL